MMKLNRKQRLFFHRVKSFLSQSQDKAFYLFGYAGSGKTFIISKLIQYLLLHDTMDKILICAPTHKALNVIESYIKSNLKQIHITNLEFMTIHRLLEFKPVIVAEDGSKVFKSSKKSNLIKSSDKKLIVIDECSMINSDMVTELKKYMQQYPIRVIFMGDKAQLPPVGENMSSIFDISPDYVFQITLDEIMRTKSPDIKTVSAIIRGWNTSESLTSQLSKIYKTCDKASFEIYHKKPDHLKSAWFKRYVTQLKLGKIPIILTWCNATADHYNTILRQYIHGTDNLELYNIGDYAMFNNFYVSTLGERFYTSDMIKIIHVRIETRNLIDWQRFKINNPTQHIHRIFNMLISNLSKINTQYRINIFSVKKLYSDIGYLTDDIYTVQTIDKRDLVNYEIHLEEIREQIEFFFHKHKSKDLSISLWDAFHKYLIDPYAQLCFGYSITTYKAQGSTFSTVFVDVQDICEVHQTYSEDLRKALYTACTRASDHLGLLLV